MSILWIHGKPICCIHSALINLSKVKVSRSSLLVIINISSSTETGGEEKAVEGINVARKLTLGGWTLGIQWSLKSNNSKSEAGKWREEKKRMLTYCEGREGEVASAAAIPWNAFECMLQRFPCSPCTESKRKDMRIER